jgi:hypothetical protein
MSDNQEQGIEKQVAGTLPFPALGPCNLSPNWFFAYPALLSGRYML